MPSWCNYYRTGMCAKTPQDNETLTRPTTVCLASKSKVRVQYKYIMYLRVTTIITNPDDQDKFLVN